jgi:predicted transcriptional regulator
MQLSKSELNLLKEIANGNKNINEVAKAIRKSRSQTYRLGQELMKKNILSLNESEFEPSKLVHVSLLLQLLSEFSSTIKPLSGTGIQILSTLLSPKSIAEIISETGLDRSTIFKKLKEAKAISLVRINKKTYSINELIWSNAKQFLSELKTYESTLDYRVPANAIIYFKKKDKLVFSCREDIDATLTAFSAYVKYGIKILSPTRYYCLPKKELTKEETFLHSLYVADKDKSARHITFITLFFAKFREELSKIKHPLINLIERIISGEKISRYPNINEIREKAEVYDIKI